MATNGGSSAALLEAGHRDPFDEIVRLMNGKPVRRIVLHVEHDAFVLEAKETRIGHSVDPSSPAPQTATV
jgi:hypothetical protein